MAYEKKKINPTKFNKFSPTVLRELVDNKNS